MNVKKILSILTLLCIPVFTINWLWFIKPTVDAHTEEKQRKVEIHSITADFRITKADGAKTLKQIFDAQNPQIIPPNRLASSLYFIVSSECSNLTLTSPGHTPGDFQMIVASGDSKLFPLSDLPLELVTDGTIVSSNGISDVFVHIELIPK